MEYLQNSQGILLQPVSRQIFKQTQNLPLGNNIQISCVCIYLAEPYTAVYAAYEYYNPTVFMKLANLYFWIAY